jgi:hypothetical protein
VHGKAKIILRLERNFLLLFGKVRLYLLLQLGLHRSLRFKLAE